MRSRPSGEQGAASGEVGGRRRTVPDPRSLECGCDADHRSIAVDAAHARRGRR
ncbi:hypothetical protein [Nocardia nova]|uniref:hypothetical protein n=1 Tax=Nocardia nova TaxID=37330 RepID=UPI00130DB005|nr:hypothetical protein [Nocardia nova]